ncbi:MAG: PKD domain-containing protein [Myxococcota bacterium]
MWLLSACIGLDTLPERDERKDGDLDSVPLETGHPLDTSTTGGGGTDENARPVADAGDDAEATVNVVVELDGTGSSDPDGDALAYAWTLIEKPRGSSAELINDTRAEASFVPDLAGRYVAELVVDDGQAASEPDEVEVTAAEDNGEPVANAGPDQTVTVGSTVSLDGSASTDPDDDPLQFAWTMTSRPSGSSASLSNASSATPRFTADAAGAYELSLTVSDGTTPSEPDEVRIIAEPDASDTGSDDCGCSAGGADVAGGLLLALASLRARRRR